MGSGKMTGKEQMLENLKTIREACVRLSDETEYELGEVVGRLNEEIRLLRESPGNSKSSVKSAQQRVLSEKRYMSEDEQKKVDEMVKSLGGLEEIST